MCANCSDERHGPCICAKHGAERRKREESFANWKREVAYCLEDYRRGNRHRAEVALGHLGYVGPETSWDYETEGGAL